MIFTHQIKLTCKEVENRIEKDAEGINLMLKHHYPFSVNLPKNGFEIKEYASVFELCRENLAAKLLNTQPELNVIMPCRISVYEKNGIGYVSTPNLEMQLDALDCKNEPKKEILNLYAEIKNMIEKW